MSPSPDDYEQWTRWLVRKQAAVPLAQAVVTVRCAACSRKLGNGTRLGQMVLTREGQWGWVAFVRRRRVADGRRTLDLEGSPTFSGGVQVSCRRCGAVRRAGLRKLAQRAEGAGDSDILL